MQLSSFENITEDNIVFHTAKKHKVPNSKIKYQKNKDWFLFSFGISERKDQETNKVSGYSIPVYLWKKDVDACMLNPVREGEEDWSDSLPSSLENFWKFLVLTPEDFPRQNKRVCSPFLFSRATVSTRPNPSHRYRPNFMSSRVLFR